MWHCIVGCIVTFPLSLVVVPRVTEAQPTGQIYRIGWLAEGVRPEEPFLLEALRMLGYVEGHNLFIERRFAETRKDLPALAAELVTRQVDLIMTNGTPATRAAQQVTTTIPIVFRLAADPVQSGLVASYARPGGNLTGVAARLYEDKLLEILKEAVPGMRRVACPCRRDSENPTWARIADAAQGLGLEILDMAVQGPDDFAPFFAAARRAGADAVLVHDVA
jgi:putative ABC transport system substrate-binding protein